MTPVLCVGNGGSQEPRFIATGGFEVVALDLSPVGIDLARKGLGSEEEVAEMDAAARAAGGSVKYVVGDLLDPEACPGPFKVVIERRTLQVVPPEERLAALEMMVRRLSPDGILVSHCHDARCKLGEKPNHATRPLLRKVGLTEWSPGQSDAAESPKGRVAFLISSTG